jgi:hypothetical protein
VIATLGSLSLRAVTFDHNYAQPAPGAAQLPALIAAAAGALRLEGCEYSGNPHHYVVSVTAPDAVAVYSSPHINVLVLSLSHPAASLPLESIPKPTTSGGDVFLSMQSPWYRSTRQVHACHRCVSMRHALPLQSVPTCPCAACCISSRSAVPPSTSGPSTAAARAIL